MSDITVRRPIKLGDEELESALELLCDTLMSQFKAEVTRQGQTIQFSGKGFSGELNAGDGELRGSLRLSALMRPFKRALSREIDQALDRYLAS
jgi:hypothetical protein